MTGLYYELFSWNSFVPLLNQRSSSEAQFGVSRVGETVRRFFRPDRLLLGLLIVICIFLSKEANEIKFCQLFRSASFWLALEILTSMSEEQTFTSACTFVPILAHNFPTGVSANFSLQYRVAFSLEIELTDRFDLLCLSVSRKL